jgi:Sulfotransferase family
MTGSTDGVPDFFIVGHEKCGTTALYRLLRSHPDVYMPELKEPRFFMREHPARRSPGEERTQSAPGALPQTLEEYVALFTDARPDQVVGEASPQYIRSPGAAARIGALRPDARAIAILREPVAFLRSFHLACVRSGLEDERDLRKALELEPARKRGERIPPGCNAPDRLLYSEHVRYVGQLRRLEEALSREQLHVIVYDDLRRENERVAREALRFLGVDETLPIDVSNSTGRQRKAVRNVRLHRFATALRRARRQPETASLPLRALSAVATARAETLGRRALYATAAPVDETLAGQLRERFRPEVAALAERLDRDLLAEWGYSSASPAAGDGLR